MRLALSILLALCATDAIGAPERYLESDDAKDPELSRSCVISDYGDLVADEKVQWVWVASDVKLAAIDKLDVEPVPNRSDVTDPEIGEKTTEAFRQAFQRVGKSIGPGGYKIKACIFWMQRAGGGRAFVPYAGFYLAQAGVGIEAVVIDPNGQVVAKLRHTGREGGDPKGAAFELVDEIANYVRDH